MCSLYTGFPPVSWKWRHFVVRLTRTQLEFPRHIWRENDRNYTTKLKYNSSSTRRVARYRNILQFFLPKMSNFYTLTYPISLNVYELPSAMGARAVHIILQYIYIYTGYNRRKGPDFGRVFLMLNYTEKPQNTYIQSWMVWEIMASVVWNFDSCYTLTDYQIRIETGRNMLFLYC